MQPYIAQLRAKYPSADGPSLVAAFLVLHELTAVVPLFAGFWACRLLGVGASLVGWAIAESETGEEPSWAQRKVKTWVGQGENQAERLGRRYGVFGFEKETREERQSRRAANDDTQDVAMSVGTHSIGGDVANLVAAYLAVKALLPLRIVASLRLAPPLANVISRRFVGLRNLGARWLRKQPAAPSSRS